MTGAQLPTKSHFDAIRSCRLLCRGGELVQLPQRRGPGFTQRRALGADDFVSRGRFALFRAQTRVALRIAAGKLKFFAIHCSTSNLFCRAQTARARSICANPSRSVMQLARSRLAREAPSCSPSALSFPSAPRDSQIFASIMLLANSIGPPWSGAQDLQLCQKQSPAPMQPRPNRADRAVHAL